VEDSSKPETRVLFNQTGRQVYPTIVDPAPTALQWLGYGDRALGEFARSSFESYFKEWAGEQKQSCSNNVVQLLVESLRRTEYEAQYHFSADDLKGSIEEIFSSLCLGLPQTIPTLPDFKTYEAEGNMLRLDD
jgi:hypothetical protein